MLLERQIGPDLAIISYEQRAGGGQVAEVDWVEIYTSVGEARKLSHHPDHTLSESVLHEPWKTLSLRFCLRPCSLHLATEEVAQYEC